MKLLHQVLAMGVGVAVALGVPAAAPAGADERNDAVAVDVALDGRSIGNGSAPFELDPADEVLLELVVENGTAEDVTVHKVRIAGDALGMTFFTFSTRIDVVVRAGDTEARTFSLDVAELDGQASGLLEGRVELVGDDGEVVASRGFTADARGAGTSTYSLFGALVALLTGVLLVGVVLGLRKGTLPDNRFSRALRFAEPGAGLGLALTFTLSSLRIVLVPAATGLVLLGAGAAVGFVVGYTLARPDEAEGRTGVPSIATAWLAAPVAGSGAEAVR